MGVAPRASHWPARGQAARAQDETPPPGWSSETTKHAETQQDMKQGSVR